MLNAKSEYERLEPERTSYERRAEIAAKLTIPSLYSRAGDAHGRTTHTPYQSVGALGVSNLSSAIMLGLLPPGLPFFNLSLDPKLRADLRDLQDGGQAGTPLTDVESNISVWEKTIMRSIERSNYRTPGELMVRLAMVTGNALVEFLPEGGQRTYKLNSYVCERNPDGTPYRVIIKEEMRVGQLTDDVKRQYSASAMANASILEDDDATVMLYTMVTWGVDDYTIQAWLEDVELEGEEYQSSGPVKDCPFHAIRFQSYDGEHYGRGLADEYLGALRTAESLTQSIVQGAAAAAKVLFLVRPGSVTNPRSLANAPNLSFKSGVAGDITTLQLGKFADFQVAQASLNKVESSLERIFLVGSIRNAERVTTAEIRFIQDQLERGHTGVFARFAADWQEPLVRHTIKRLARENALPKLPESVAVPVIVTGASALGRSNEADKLKEIMVDTSQAFGQEVAASYFEVSSFISRMAAAKGVETSGIVKTKDEVQAEQQQAMQSQLMSQVGGAAVDVGANAIGGALEAAQQQQQPEQPQVA